MDNFETKLPARRKLRGTGPATDARLDEAIFFGPLRRGFVTASVAVALLVAVSLMARAIHMYRPKGRALP